MRVVAGGGAGGGGGEYGVDPSIEPCWSPPPPHTHTVPYSYSVFLISLTPYSLHLSITPYS